MPTELITALSGLVGAVIGAMASILGTMIIEKRRWRREQRADAIRCFTEGLLSGDRLKAVEMKLAFAMIGKPENVRGYIRASELHDIVDNINAVVRDVINEERAARRLAPLSLEDVEGLLIESLEKEVPVPRRGGRK
ncbi:hypothetical protein ACFYUR_20810 [Micromonospora haikouensis]|uniref:hypothetical protein n=1 Tax=Micromonospora haikouensis TaxID=686309 RepID=UPI0036BB61FB